MKANFLTIAQANQLLEKGKLSSWELTKSCLEQIKAKDGSLGAFVRVFEKKALEQAREADRRRREERSLGKLDGIPLAIKDNICVKGAPTTAGSKILEEFVSPYEATVIKKLRRAGAVFLGKTNLDEFAQGSSTENSAFKATKNPYDSTRVPGGSSGGSAVAVASGMCLGALGSDTGGSIRLPASFCSVVGLKPTYGAVSRYGLVAMGSSLDQIGPLVRTSEDAEIIFRAISGRDLHDATSRNLKPCPKSRKIRLGIASFHQKSPNQQINRLFEKVTRQLREHPQVEFGLASPVPSARFALSTYYIIMPVEVASNMARFDGIRFGYSAENDKSLALDSLHDVYAKSRGNPFRGFGEEVKRRIIIGTYASSAGYADKYYHRAQKLRGKIQEEFCQVFAKTDVLISLVCTLPPFPLGQKTQNPLEMYKTDILTVQANIVGIPAMSLPIGFIRAGQKRLPVGIQIMAPHFREDLLFKLGKIIERLIGELKLQNGKSQRA